MFTFIRSFIDQFSFIHSIHLVNYLFSFLSVLKSIYINVYQNTVIICVSSVQCRQIFGISQVHFPQCLLFTCLVEVLSDVRSWLYVSVYSGLSHRGQLHVGMPLLHYVAHRHLVYIQCKRTFMLQVPVNQNVCVAVYMILLPMPRCIYIVDCLAVIQV